jgi:hypothetical protein
MCLSAVTDTARHSANSRVIKAGCCFPVLCRSDGGVSHFELAVVYGAALGRCSTDCCVGMGIDSISKAQNFKFHLNTYGVERQGN